MAALLTWLKQAIPFTYPSEEKERSKKEKRDAYQRAISKIENFLKNISDDTEKIALLDYAIETLKQDIIGSKRAEIFYVTGNPELINLFPPSQDKNSQKEDLNLADVDILAAPYDLCRLQGAVCDLYRTSFDCDERHYTAEYYPEVNLLLIKNGIHHTAVADIKGDGRIKGCTIIQLANMFSNYGTDGALWIDSRIEKENDKNKHVLGYIPREQSDVQDFRFAVLYTLAQMRYKMQGNRGDGSSAFPFVNE